MPERVKRSRLRDVVGTVYESGILNSSDMSSDTDSDPGKILTSDSESDTDMRFLRTSDSDVDSGKVMTSYTDTTADTGLSENLGHGLGHACPLISGEHIELHL